MVETKIIEIASKKYQLNKEDGAKIIKGFGIAMGAAALTIVTDLIPQIEWGQWTPIVVVASSVLINAGRKFLQGKKK